LESVYIIDSFPVPVCKNIGIPMARIIKGEEFRGYNASKREYFYGFKVHLISTGAGIPVEFLITLGSTHDNRAFQTMEVDLPENSHLYGDAAYLNGEMKSLLMEFGQIRLKAATKRNSIEKNTWAQELENKYFRKHVENIFSEITYKFPKKYTRSPLPVFCSNC
jgi:Transposase DDE domain